MRERGTNYWITWADLTFLLFIAALAGMAAVERRLASANTESERLHNEAQALRVQLEDVTLRFEALRRTSNPCADAGAFLDGFSSCVSRRLQRPKQRKSGCFVTLGEDVIQFANGSAIPLSPAAADSVAGCLYEHALSYYRRDKASFRAITIHVDGHTDCVGFSVTNEDLGAARAVSIYSRFLAGADRDRSLSRADRGEFLSRIAVRSFGESRPVHGSQCTEARGWAPDRRVVISVQLATENSNPFPNREGRRKR